MESARQFVHLQALAHMVPSDVVIAILGLVIFSALVQRLRSKAPTQWPVLGSSPSFFSHLNEFHEWITEALIRSGGSFSFTGVWLGGFYGVITLDPANMQHILKTRFSNFPKGRYYRERFHDLLGGGIFNADGDEWREQRRAAQSEMHSSRFSDYAAQTVEHLVRNKLLKLIAKLEESGRCVDLQDLLLRFSFDSICSAAFGTDPGCLDHDLPEVPFARAFEVATELTLFRFMVPPLVWKPMRFLCVGAEKRLRHAVGVVHSFAEKCVSDRRAERRKLGKLHGRCDLLSRFMETPAEQGSGCRFSDTYLKDMCVSFILAGRDTSSVGLAWFFWLLHQHPHVESRIVAEVADILAQRTEPTSGDVVFTIAELKKMEYLQAAISEALRLYPPVPLDYKEALEDDVLPDGTAVKKGARVFYSIYSMARCNSIWGNDCREFRPERWLMQSNFVTDTPFKYMVFNAGPRLCIGKKFAYLQMKMLAASVLVRHSVRVLPGQVITPKLTTTLYMKYGMHVTFTPRDPLPYNPHH